MDDPSVSQIKPESKSGQESVQELVQEPAQELAQESTQESTQEPVQEEPAPELTHEPKTKAVPWSGESLVGLRSAFEQCSWAELEKVVKSTQTTYPEDAVAKIEKALKTWPSKFKDKRSLHRSVAHEFGHAILDREEALATYWRNPSEQDLTIYRVQVGFNRIKGDCLAAKFIPIFGEARWIKLRNQALWTIKGHKKFDWKDLDISMRSVRNYRKADNAQPEWEELTLEGVIKVLPPPRNPDLLKINRVLVGKIIDENFSLQQASDSLSGM